MNERNDFGSYAPDILSHRLYAKASPYTVLNVGIGTGAEAIPLFNLYAQYSRLPQLYLGTNVVTPPDFRLTEEFMQTRFPTIPFEYRNGFFMEDGIGTESVSLFLASRVAEWSDDPIRWFSEAYRSLQPGGIGIVHSSRQFPRFDNAVINEVLQEAGIATILVDRAPDLDQYTETNRIYLYKPHNDAMTEFPDWVETNPHRFETHFNALSATSHRRDVI
ncbi:methyltransferase domain-containing protein [Candidatus Roizmanbacteria bacterium]|nr:MAG: methyltransferase domain-containing protein [Candidatus Roizmanbacteria bacterium]